MSKRYAVAYISLFVIFVFLIFYNIRLRNSELVASAAQGGNTAATPVALPDTATQRWTERVAASGNCSLRPAIPTWDNYFDMVEKQNKCAVMKKFGGQKSIPKGDGSKNLCMDDAIAPRRGDCTVISVGINNEWSFDDAMAAWGCKVYAFDPTMSFTDHQRGAMIQFHNLGLSKKRGIIYSKKTPVPVDSYRGVLAHVGLTNQTIDYLKIDIEGSEIGFFENVLYEDMDVLQHVKQMGVEIHVWRENVQSRDRLWKIYNRLECLGFKKVYSEINLAGGTAYVYKRKRRVACCYELVWVNEAFL